MQRNILDTDIATHLHKMKDIQQMGVGMCACVLHNYTSSLLLAIQRKIVFLCMYALVYTFTHWYETVFQKFPYTTMKQPLLYRVHQINAYYSRCTNIVFLDGYDQSSAHHHDLMCSLMMTCCDISDTCKEWEMAKSIAVRSTFY